MAHKVKDFNLDGTYVERNATTEEVAYRETLESQRLPNALDSLRTRTNILLAKTDWLVTRKAEAGTAIPSATATYRTNVRTQCGLREATINACADTDKLCATIRNTLAPTVAGTASNGATEKKKEDGSSYDPVQYNDIANPDLLEDWPTEP